MPARRRAPTVTNWARELQNYGSGERLEASALAEILQGADRRLEEMWSYLRDVDATSAQNLRGFEAFLEVVAVGGRGNDFGNAFIAAHGGETKARAAGIERHYDSGVAAVVCHGNQSYAEAICLERPILCPAKP